MMEVTNEAIARAIAMALGDNYDHAFANKAEWLAERGERGGRFRDVNEPFRCDYDAAAAIALTTAHAEAEALRKEVERLTDERQELLDMVGNLSGSLNLTRDYNPEQTVGAFYERVPYCKMASDMAHRFCEADFAREETALERKP